MGFLYPSRSANLVLPLTISVSSVTHPSAYNAILVSILTTRNVLIAIILRIDAPNAIQLNVWHVNKGISLTIIQSVTLVRRAAAENVTNQQFVNYVRNISL